jgi:hypothetical protein
MLQIEFKAGHGHMFALAALPRCSKRLVKITKGIDLRVQMFVGLHLNFSGRMQLVIEMSFRGVFCREIRPGTPLQPDIRGDFSSLRSSK